MTHFLATPEISIERRVTRSSSQKSARVQPQKHDKCRKFEEIQEVTDKTKSSPNTAGREGEGQVFKDADNGREGEGQVLVFKDADNEQFQPRDGAMMGRVGQCLSAANLNVECGTTAPLGRQKEFDGLRDILQDCFQQQKGSAIYICGLPGTGKTMTVNRVLQSIEQQYSSSEEHSPVFVNFNCGSARQFGGLFGMIYHQYMRTCNSDAGQKQQFSQQDDFDAAQIPEQEHYEFFEKLVTSQTSSRKRRRRSSIGSQSKGRRRSSICSQSLTTKSYGMIVVVMDEVDFIIQKDGRQLQELMSLCWKDSSRLIFIGISNQLDLPDKYLSQFQSSLQTLQFNAYSDNIMMENILRQRLNELPWEVIEGNALGYICREVCNNSGDMRMALKMTQAAIENLAETPYNIVNTSVAIGVVQKWMDKQHCQTIEIIKNLPQLQKVLLACLVKQTIEQDIQISQEKQSKKKRRITIGKSVKKGAFTQRWIYVRDLHKCFEAERQKLKVSGMSFSVVKQVCEVIQDGANLVRIKGNCIDNFRVALATDMDVIKHAFKDCGLIKRIYQQ